MGDAGLRSRHAGKPGLHSDMVGGSGIAHTIVSFGFSDGQHIAFSLGIRPERGEAYSSVAGFFKPYELILTEADARDVVQLRTSVQTGNRVVLYRIHGDRAILRPLFLEYLDLANNLAERPRFYRTILDNCTTVTWKLVDRLVPGLPIDYRVVLSGYLPEYLYDRGVLDMCYSLQQLTAWVSCRRRSNMTAQVLAFPPQSGPGSHRTERRPVSLSRRPIGRRHIFSAQ